MKTKLKAYLPIWFLVMVPALLLLLLISNFITTTLGLLVTIFLFSIPTKFKIYKKNILKIFGISFLLDLIAFIFIIATELFTKVKFINNNIVANIEYNPYLNFFSALYMVIVFVFVTFIGYKLINHFIIKKMPIRDDNKKIATIIVLLFSLPYLLFVPSTFVENPSKNNIEDFKGTIMGDHSDIVSIMKYLSISKYISSYVLNDKEKPYSLDIYLKSIDINYIKMFEADSAIFFNLVANANQITFHMDSKTYTYTISEINKIFNGNIKKIAISKINKRYTDSKFTDYTYLGHIGNYDVFDESEVCDETPQKLFEYQEETYYLECSDINEVKLYNSSNKSYSLKEALDSNLVSQEEIIDSYLNIVNDKSLSNN